MNIQCNNCKKSIHLNNDTLNFIKESRQKGKKLIMLPCDKCGLDFSFSPIIPKERYYEQLVWRCPTSGCHGYVTYINKNETPYNDEKDFYGCSETGKKWYQKESFFADIEDIIKKYPYRNKCYEYKNNEWLSLDCDIEHLIDTEEDRRWN